MLTTYPDLLPSSSTPLERALAGPTGRLTAIAVPLRDLWRWDTCPAPLLPWLAWAMSVDIWVDTWSTEKKRAIIRESFELHRRKGSLHAIQRYLSYLDVPLKGWILPPDKAFAGAPYTDEQRTDYLARFPQIRIFKFRSNGDAGYNAFGTGAFRLGKTFLGARAGLATVGLEYNDEPLTWNDETMTWSGHKVKGTTFPYRTDAWARIGRRAFFWDKGPHYLATDLEKPLKWIERTVSKQAETYYVDEQVRIPGAKVPAIFLDAAPVGNNGGKNGRNFLAVSTAADRIVTVAIKRGAVTEADVLRKHMTVGPALEPINAFPEHVAERGTSKRGVHVFMGMPGRYLDPSTRQRKVVKGFCQGFLPETSSGERLYERFYLHDPKRLPDQRPRSTYLGHVRLGMPAYHAVLAPQINGKRSVDEATVGRFCAGHLSASNQSTLHNARKAVQRSMAVRDKILLKTQLHRTVTTRDLVRSGSGVRSGGFVAVPLV